MSSTDIMWTGRRIGTTILWGIRRLWGASMMTVAQKNEAVALFGKIKLSNSIDYVGAWYYSGSVVYNNFPWPSETSQTHDGKDGLPTVHDTKNDSDSDSCKSMKDGQETGPPSITRTAQAILDARAKYPDCSLAALYDETTMPAEPRRAHEANDSAVMKAYGFRADKTEGEIVAELFKMYERLTV